MSTTTADRVIVLGPHIGLQWHSTNGPPSGFWVQRGAVEYLRAHLLPAQCPRPGVPESCWLWVGAVASDGRPMMVHQSQWVPVRRLLYDLRYGPLANRDYLVPVCGVPRCCNPGHQQGEARGPLPRERLTPAQRLAANTCGRGHPLTPNNVYVFGGHRYCRTCRQENAVRYRERNRRR